MDQNVEVKKLSSFIGQTVTHVRQENNYLIFSCASGKKFEMLHIADCCEEVNLVDIEGDLEDLIDTPILNAEKVFSGEEDCMGWTYYKMATIKGHVTIRWYGESNGYYSVAVDFFERSTAANIDSN